MMLSRDNYQLLGCISGEIFIMSKQNLTISRRFSSDNQCGTHWSFSPIIFFANLLVFFQKRERDCCYHTDYNQRPDNSRAPLQFYFFPFVRLDEEKNLALAVSENFLIYPTNDLYKSAYHAQNSHVN